MKEHIDTALGLQDTDDEQTVTVDEVENFQVPMTSATPHQVIVNEEKGDIEPDPEVLEVIANYKSLFEKGNTALNELLKVARSSNSARAYEVVATLIKSLTDTNKHVHDAHQSLKEEMAFEDHKEEANQPQGDTINNTLNFVGSTADLQRMIQDLKKKEQ